MNKLNFGKQLIKFRKARGLTQFDVAEKCNVTILTIQRIESGAVKPRSSTIKIISETLGADYTKDFDEYKIEESFVFVTKKHGLLTIDGETIIPCEYDTIKLTDQL